jgi:hypothetical protein
MNDSGKAPTTLNISSLAIGNINAWYSEIPKAHERIRRAPDSKGRLTYASAPAATMNWLIQFAALELDALSSGDFSNLQYELDCFRRFGPNPPVLSSGYAVSLGKVGNRLLAPPLPEKGPIAQAQAWLRQSLDCISGRQTGSQLEWQAPATVHRLVWIQGAARWVTPTELLRQDPTEPELHSEMFSILKAHAADIWRCPCGDCKRIFLRSRTNQEYCSKRCQMRQAKRDQKQITPDRYGKVGRPPKQQVEVRYQSGKKGTANRGTKKRK